MNQWTVNLNHTAGPLAWPSQRPDSHNESAYPRVSRDIPPTLLPLDPLLELKKAEVVKPVFRSPPSSRLDADTRVGESTVAEVVKNYAAAYWNFRRKPLEAQRHAGIRAAALKQLGASTAHGVALAQRLTAVGKFVTQLAAAARTSLRAFPDDRILVDEVAAEVMARGLVGLSDGVPVGDPTGTLNYYIQPRVAERLEKLAAIKLALETRLAEAAAQKQAEAQAVQQIAEIRNFWTLINPGTSAGFNYCLGGVMVFHDIEDMESFCPASSYQRSFPAIVQKLLDRVGLVYDGKAVTEVYLLQAAAPPRKVSFRGASWTYTDQEPPEDRIPQRQVAASAHRHFNARWNADPRVVNERSAASKVGRDIIG